jgi:hypothetical protein
MTRLLAVALAIGVAGWAAQASACPLQDKTTATIPQTVVDSTSPTTLPITPIPAPAPVTKTGG